MVGAALPRREIFLESALGVNPFISIQVRNAASLISRSSQKKSLGRHQRDSVLYDKWLAGVPQLS
jgi:hypothetical protein